MLMKTRNRSGVLGGYFCPHCDDNKKDNKRNRRRIRRIEKQNWKKEL